MTELEAIEPTNMVPFHPSPLEYGHIPRQYFWLNWDMTWDYINLLISPSAIIDMPSFRYYAATLI